MHRKGRRLCLCAAGKPERRHNPEKPRCNNKKATSRKTGGFGPSGESRTHGLLNPIQARYQTALHPVIPGRQSANIIIPARMAFVKGEALVFACFFTKSSRQRGCSGGMRVGSSKKLHLQHGAQEGPLTAKPPCDHPNTTKNILRCINCAFITPQARENLPKRGFHRSIWQEIPSKIPVYRLRTEATCAIMVDNWVSCSCLRAKTRHK